MSNPEPVKRYIGVCVLCDRLAEEEDECKTCGSNVLEIDAAVITTDVYDRDIKALELEVFNGSQLLAEQTKTIERLQKLLKSSLDKLLPAEQTNTIHLWWRIWARKVKAALKEGK